MIQTATAITTAEAAAQYLARGWQPVPVPAGTKGPRAKGWQTRLWTPEDFATGGNIGIVLGDPSGGLVDVDLDCPEATQLADDYLPATVETGRAGNPRSHRWYVCRGVATRQFHDPIDRTMIVELRSTGGQTLVGPSIHPETSEPYEMLEGQPAAVPAGLLEAGVKALAEAVLANRGRTQTAELAEPARPTPPRRDALDHTDAERRAVAYLERMPAAISGSGGHNATYKAATALVHGFCLDPETALRLLLDHYNPRCQGPWTEKELAHKVQDAAAKPHERPRGWLLDQAPPERATAAAGVDLSALMAPSAVPPAVGQVGPVDPGPTPERLLKVPGFVGEVMDYCLSTAPYPNRVMAFAGALSLQAFLAGRKVRDSGDNRTNLYLLGLAQSAAGKDRPRKVNTRIVHEVGLANCLGESFASGEGIQDALFQTPGMLFQTDEIDGMLQSINKARDARHEAVMTTLLTMYSSSTGIYPMRRKAGKESPGVIDQPCLVIFGTAIPNHYYEALSERMLTNGFFARTLVLESGPRGAGQSPSIRAVPARVLDTARWWADYRPGTGNLENWHPEPKVIEYDAEAERIVAENRLAAEAEYDKAEKIGDSIGTTVWGRVNEQVRKLALIYTVSENREATHIDLAAVEWASAFVMHQTRRMLYMAASHVADNPFHAECQKLMKKLRDAPGNELPHSVLLKRMKTDMKTFSTLIETLAQQGDIEEVAVSTPGRSARVYRTVGG